MEDTPVHTPEAPDAAPDVLLSDLAPFVRPDVTLDQFEHFDTPAPAKKGVLREWVESLAFTIIFVLIFTNYIAQATQVPTESMKPTILVGDHFFLDKLAFPANFPVAVRSYLPGDKIEVRSKNLVVNGQKLDEPYKIHVDPQIYHEDPWTPDELKVRDNFGPVEVPPDKFFVMGDNRDNSNDSRYWGFVDRSEVIGKPLFVYWSYESDPYVPGDKTVQEWIASYASVAIHFFSRTRWFRIGTMIE
jgi:signal peptidase I